MKPGFIVMIAVVAGCVGAAASKLVIPPARAQNVQRWEYFCFEGSVMSGGSRRRNFLEGANKAGREGWEYAVDEGDSHCFKRPLP
jgi:hypothetical protein